MLAYFIPSLYNTFGIIDPGQSRLYYVASRYLLPATLVLLTLSIDFKAILRLGPKALVMFLTGTLGIILGGPIAVMLVSLVSPETVGGSGPDAVWRGLTTIAGSWIGGSANQAAMKEVFGVGDQIFSAMIAVDVLIGNLWIAVLLYLAAKSPILDARLGADTTAIDELRQRVQAFRDKHARIPTFTDLMFIVAIGFGIGGLSHFIADWLAPWIAQVAPGLERLSLTSQFFWVVVLATTGGLLLSFTRAPDSLPSGGSGSRSTPGCCSWSVERSGPPPSSSRWAVWPTWEARPRRRSWRRPSTRAWPRSASCWRCWAMRWGPTGPGSRGS